MCVSVGVSAGGREKKRVQKNGVLVLSGSILKVVVALEALVVW